MDDYINYIIFVVFALLSGVIGSLLSRPKQKETTKIVVVDGRDKETEMASIPATEHNMPAAIGIEGPKVPPKPVEESLSPKELEKKRLELITSFPEITLVTNNLDRFKELLSLPKIPTPSEIKPTKLLAARRISDMVYKHQKILLGLSKLTKERIFAAVITLMEEKSQDE